MKITENRIQGDVDALDFSTGRGNASYACPPLLMEEYGAINHALMSPVNATIKDH
jgi:hypothetical protein